MNCIIKQDKINFINIILKLQKWHLTEFLHDLINTYYERYTLPTSCAVVMKSGNLNFLEPSGSLRACNGTALHFYYERYI